MKTNKFFTATQNGFIAHVNYFGLMMPVVVMVEDMDRLPIALIDGDGNCAFRLPSGNYFWTKPVII